VAHDPREGKDQTVWGSRVKEGGEKDLIRWLAEAVRFDCTSLYSRIGGYGRVERCFGTAQYNKRLE